MSKQQFNTEQQVPFHWNDLTQKIRQIFGNTYTIQLTAYEEVNQR